MKVDYSAYLKKITGKGKIYYCVLIGLLGVMLIISGDGYDIKKEKTTDNTEFLQEYKIKTEKELTDFLASIEGVGAVKVVVSLETGRENVYAQKEKSQCISLFFYFIQYFFCVAYQSSCAMTTVHHSNRLNGQLSRMKPPLYHIG